MVEPVRRIMLIELDSTKRWSSSETETFLNERIGDLRPVVLGSISSSDVDGTYRKLRQLSREIEEEATKEDCVHSAHKALSFFRDMFSSRFWEWCEIGKDQTIRQRRLK